MLQLLDLSIYIERQSSLRLLEHASCWAIRVKSQQDCEIARSDRKLLNARSRFRVIVSITNSSVDPRMALERRCCNSPSVFELFSRHILDHKYLFRLVYITFKAIHDIPLPSPNSFIVSLAGRRNRFLISSLVGHLPSCMWRSVVVCKVLPVNLATPKAVPVAAARPRILENDSASTISAKFCNKTAGCYTSQSRYRTSNGTSVCIIPSIVGVS